MESTALKIIELLCDKLGIAYEYMADIAQEQLLPYAQQLAKQYAVSGFCESLVLAVTCLIFLAGAIILIIYAFRYDDDDGLREAGVASGAIIGAIALIVCAGCVVAAVRWKCAPDAMVWKNIISELNH